MPLWNSRIPAAVETNQFQFFWKIRSPVPCSVRIAFRRDLVVLDCQPPSWSFTKVSPISAIRLPWRNTKLTPSLLTTMVLSCFQSTSRVMAAFMRRSILRMGWIALTWVVWVRMGAIATPLVPVWKVSHVVAEVTFLHAIPPGCIGIVVELLGNIQTEIIAFCHWIVEVNVVFVTLNNVGVEVVVGHEFLSNRSNITHSRVVWWTTVPVWEVAQGILTYLPSIE